MRRSFNNYTTFSVIIPHFPSSQDQEDSPTKEKGIAMKRSLWDIFCKVRQLFFVIPAFNTYRRDFSAKGPKKQ